MNFSFYSSPADADHRIDDDDHSAKNGDIKFSDSKTTGDNTITIWMIMIVMVIQRSKVRVTSYLFLHSKE
jgi:hypothetical protein